MLFMPFLPFLIIILVSVILILALLTIPLIDHYYMRGRHFRGNPRGYTSPLQNRFNAEFGAGENAPQTNRGAYHSRGNRGAYGNATFYIDDNHGGDRNIESSGEVMADDFPYWKLSMAPPEVMFNHLMSLDFADFVTSMEDGGTGHGTGEPIITLHRSYPKDYELCDRLSSHFTEYERIQCKFGNHASPAEVWVSMTKKGRIDPVIKAGINKLTNPVPNYNALREYVYSVGKRECNTFNPAYMKWMLMVLIKGTPETEELGFTALNKDYGEIKILDPSAGWGDRMICAMSLKVAEYNGFDPNSHLIKGYNDILTELGPIIGLDPEIPCANGNGRYNIQIQEFEKSAISPEYYDIAITSPPFFTLEVYGRKKINGDYRTWMERMYTPYLLNMCNAVKIGGYIIIYIEDFGQYMMRKDTKNIIKTFGGCQYIGELGHIVDIAGVTNPRARASIVFRKASPIRI